MRQPPPQTTKPTLIFGCSRRARRLLDGSAAPWVAVLVALSVHAPVFADEAAEIRGLIAQGNLDVALARAERATEAHPRDPQARFLHGVVLMDLHRDDQALALFMRLAQEYPELPDPYNNMALLHARAGRLEPARQALETALRNDPGHATARANLGRVYLMLAVRAWEQAVGASPMDQPLQRKLDAARAILAAPEQPGR